MSRAAGGMTSLLLLPPSSGASLMLLQLAMLPLRFGLRTVGARTELELSLARSGMLVQVLEQE
jgi:hypothetical protein